MHQCRGRRCVCRPMRLVRYAAREPDLDPDQTSRNGPRPLSHDEQGSERDRTLHTPNPADGYAKEITSTLSYSWNKLAVTPKPRLQENVQKTTHHAPVPPSRSPFSHRSIQNPEPQLTHHH
jgi:hypothetical protein